MNHTSKAAVVGAFLFAGCSASGSGSVSLTAKPSAATQAIVSVVDGTTPTGPVALSRIRLVLNEAELRGGGGRGGHHGGRDGGGGPLGAPPAGMTSDTSFCAHRGHHVEQGPFLITIDAASLSGSTTEPVLLADVPAGTYKGAELEVGPLGAEDLSAAKAGRPAKPAEAPLDIASLGAEFDDFKTSGAALIIEGTSNGTAFTYSAAIQAEQESAADITVVDGQEVSLGLVIDSTNWFVDASGNALDPAVAENHDAIANNIKTSLTIEDDTAKP